MVAKWDHLPYEILAMIAVNLKGDQIDILRARAVSSWWRSLVPPPKYNPIFPIQVPFPIKHAGDSLIHPSPFFLSQRTLLLVSPVATSTQGPGNNSPTPWIIQVEETGPKKWSLLDCNIVRYKSYFPKCVELPSSINLLDYKITEINRSYDVSFTMMKDEGSIHWRHRSSVKKVILQSSHGLVKANGKFTLVVLYDKGDLAFWKRGAQEWTPIETSYYLVDVICYKDEIYAVERGGRLLWLDLDVCMLVDIVKNAIEVSARFLHLVEFNQNLYLVTYSADISNNITRVHVLNMKNETWDRTYHIDSAVFFVGEDIFSVSATDLGLPKGNAIYFERNVGYMPHLVHHASCSIVFDLCSNTYTDKWWLNGKPFWPPPCWIKGIPET